MKNNIKERVLVNDYWSRSARLSFWSLLLAFICFIIALVALATGVTGSGITELDISAPHALIAVVAALVFIISNFTCIISGFIAVKKCRFVLWWLIPVFLVTAFTCFVMAVAK